MATGIRLTPFLDTATPMTSAALEDTRTRPGNVMMTLLDAASVGCGAAEPMVPSARDNRTEIRRVRRMVVPGYEGMEGPRWRVPRTQVPEPATRTPRTSGSS